MKIRTIQWNIGGGKLLRHGANPTLLSSYTEDGLDEIIAFLRKHNPDIITLQETHAKDGKNQSQQIAEALGYPAWVNDEWDDSHIEVGQRIGQGIVSRYTISNHSFLFFDNPNFEAVWEDGTIAHSHDKGRTRCAIELGGDQTLTVQTLHTTPFRRFNIAMDSKQAKKVLADMGNKLAIDESGIIQADFNINTPTLLHFFPALIAIGYKEVPAAAVTTPKGEYYDHVLYKNLVPSANKVITDIRTDHYPMVTDFDFVTE